MAERDRPAKRASELFLDGGAEVVGVDEEGNCDEGEDKDGDESEDDLDPVFAHASLLAKRGRSMALYRGQRSEIRLRASGKWEQKESPSLKRSDSRMGSSKRENYQGSGSP